MDAHVAGWNTLPEPGILRSSADLVSNAAVTRCIATSGSFLPFRVRVTRGAGIFLQSQFHGRRYTGTPQSPND
jgi:hypothetical protein